MFGDVRFDDYPSAPPKKELRRTCVEETCSKIELRSSRLKTVALEPGESWRSDVTVTIPDIAKYVEMVVYFDLQNLGHKGDLPFSFQEPLHRYMGPPATRRLANRAIPEDNVEVWQGFLYVFLELPDVPKEECGDIFYIEEPTEPTKKE